MTASAAVREPAGARPAAPADVAVAIVDETGRAAWDDYVLRHADATPDHLWGWREIIPAAFGHECVYLAARRESALVGVLPLVLFRSRLFGRFVSSMPFLNYGGVLADDRAAADALLERASTIAAAFGASHLELRHHRRQFDALPARQHKLRLVRSLPASVEELWSRTDRKVRNQVRKAQQAGLTAHAGGAELVAAFYGVYARNMRDLGTPVYSSRLFETTSGVLGDRARVFVVRQGDRTLAASMTIRANGTILVPWASSLREYRALCPNMLLYWTMLEHAVREGAAVFDFGRSSPGSGTHQFKRQWGASETPLVWEYVLIAAAEAPDQGPSNPRFRLAIEGWKRLPLAVANRLGPWIASHLP